MIKARKISINSVKPSNKDMIFSINSVIVYKIKQLKI